MSLNQSAVLICQAGPIATEPYAWISAISRGISKLFQMKRAFTNKLTGMAWEYTRGMHRINGGLVASAISASKAWRLSEISGEKVDLTT